jgi:hypothetical protein
MQRAYLILFLFFLVKLLPGQNRVSFQLDLDPLVQDKLFLPEEGHRVFVRGSMNQWQGTDLELFRTAGGNLYTAIFQLEGRAGDTISYKYVIEKGQEKFFWEAEPDPGNPDHGNRRLVLKESDQQLPAALFHYDEYFSYPVIFSKEKLQADFKQFRSILEETHPALYDYTAKSVLDSLFDTNYEAIQGDMDFKGFLILMTEVISKVGCGHSSLWIPGDYWKVAPSGLFPLELLPSGEQLFVTGSFDGSTLIPVGSVIQSINGVPIEEVMARLETLSSSDGLIQAFRRASVARNFSEKYAMAYGFPETFTVGFLSPDQGRPEEAVLPGIGKTELNQGMISQNELSMRELNQGKVALLSINSFAYYNEVPMFRSFIDSVFQVLDRKGIDKLILDLRGNGGGDPFCSSYLWGYLQHKPVPYFEDHYGRYDTLANAIPQPANHYQGELYTLIDGHCFSTTGHFCGLLKYHRVGSFVGSETGATYTCTGNATYPALDRTRIMVGTARLMRYTAAVKGMDPRQGVIPDFPVESTKKDLISGRDTVLEYALSLASGH